MASKRNVKRVTIADVAREVGLSRTTVSHALNDIGEVNPETRQRIKDIAKRLKYRPSVRAQRLRTGRSQAIALLSSMPPAVSAGVSQLGFFTELAMGCARAALLRGYVVVLAPPVDRNNPLALLDIDGAILLEPAPRDPLARELHERGIPFVTIGDTPGRRNVDLHHADTARLLLQHLVDCGSRAPGLVLGSSGRESQRVFHDLYARLAKRHRFRPAVVQIPEDEGEEAAFEATRRLLAERPDLDALCVPIDTLASGAVRAAAACGRSVGRDLLLITRYDGLRARLSNPPLTAVNLHLDEISQLAVSRLLEILSDAPQKPPAPTAMPTLVVRASTSAQS